MIERMIVSNYRSLGEGVDLRLGKLTALVGPNGSGKSNIADVLRFVADCLRMGLDAAISKRHGIAAVRRWSDGYPFDISIQIQVRDPDRDEFGLYEFVLGGDSAEEYRVKSERARYGRLMHEVEFDITDGEWRSGPAELRPQIDRLGLALPLLAADDRLRPLADILRNVAIYSIFPDTLREPQKPDPTRPMSEHGANWCSILKSLQKRSEAAQQLKAGLGQVTGDIEDFRVEQIGGYLVTEFRHRQGQGPHGQRKRDKWFDAAQESDGTLRVAGIITALLQEPRLSLVGVEEPELTIHPGAIPMLYDYLAEAAEEGQVLVTTHSPDLLSKLDVDDVRVVERIGGITSVAPMDEGQRDVVRERLLNLGDLLRMEGLRQGNGERAISTEQ